MQLSKYLSQNKISDEEFALKVDASASAVVKWRRDERMPRPKFLRRISQITSGKVTAADFAENAPS